MPRVNTITLLLLGMVLASCTPQHRMTSETCDLFGSCAKLTFYMDSPEQGKRVNKAVIRELRHMQRLTQPRQNNALLRISARFRSREEFGFNPSMQLLLEKSKKYYRLSVGLYNPANGALILLWEDSLERDPKATPKLRIIRALIKNPPTMDHVKMFGIRAIGSHQNINFHFGLMTSAYAIDAQMQHLEALGINNARIELNNMVRVMGKNGARSWRLDITPLTEGGKPQRLKLSSGEAVCQLDRSALIIDPRDGMRVTHTARVLVVADSAMDAYIGCHTLYIAGPGKWQKMAEKLPITAAVVVGKDGKVETSLKTRLDLSR